MVNISRLLPGVKVTLWVEASHTTVPVASDNVKLLTSIEIPKSASLKVPLMTEFLGTPTAPPKGLTAVTPRLLATVNVQVVVFVGVTDLGVLEVTSPTQLSILALPPVHDIRSFAPFPAAKALSDPIVPLTSIE